MLVKALRNAHGLRPLVTRQPTKKVKRGWSTGKDCDVCGGRQYSTSDGNVCLNGHKESNKVVKSERKALLFPAVEGEAPKISLISIVDRWLYNNPETPVVVPVPLGGERSQGVFHPSEISKDSVCHRALAYELYSAPMTEEQHEPRVRRIFDNGTFMHVRMQYYLWNAVRANGGMFRAEISTPPNKARFAGTTDGGLVLNGWPYLVELKSINKRGFDGLRGGPRDDHFDQFNIYMHLTGVHAGLVIYECKDNQDMVEFFVRYNPERWQRIAKIGKRVLRVCREGGLPEKISVAKGCTGERCKFFSICKGGSQSKWRPPEKGLV